MSTDPKRRDFIFIATGAVAAFGTIAVVRPVLGHMMPAADDSTAAGVEVDLSLLEEGQQLKVVPFGKPIVIRHRTPDEIAAARADDGLDFKDSATDASRLRPHADGKRDPRFLIVHPICSHMGCVVVFEAGDFDGSYCPCHGAHFDTSGRVRKGPAPTNLEVPAYSWVSDTVIKLEHPVAFRAKELLAPRR